MRPGSKEIKQGNEDYCRCWRKKFLRIIEINFKKIWVVFNPLKKDSFVQSPDIAHIKPRFEDWKLIKAQALVTGKVTVSEDKIKS